jgi:hypothetical protein
MTTDQAARVREIAERIVNDWLAEGDPFATLYTADKQTLIVAIMSALAAAQAEVAAMREALEPFAKAFDRCHNTADTSVDHWQLNQHTGLTYGDLRRAVAALRTAADHSDKEGGR